MMNYYNTECDIYRKTGKQYLFLNLHPRHPPCQPIMRYISGSEGPRIDILGNEIFAKQRGNPYICFFCAAKVNTDLKSAWTLNLPFLPKASINSFQL